MNLHNVHVNRMPLDGLIKDVDHILGSHLPAFKKESERNERVIITIDTDIGTLKLIQIAGTLARRIVTYINKGDKMKNLYIILTLLFTSLLHANTYWVPSDFSSIQNALNACSPGDTVIVSAGIYYEQITVKQPVLVDV